MLSGMEKVQTLLQVLPWAIVVFGLLTMYAKYEEVKMDEE